MSLPRSDAELVIWFRNFAQHFNTHAARLGFTPAEVLAVQADAAMLEYLIADLIPSFQAGLQARTVYKNLIKNGPVGAPGGDPPAAPVFNPAPVTVAPGILPRVRKLIQRIKASPNYTDDIGSDLDTIGVDTSGPDAETIAKPTAKATALPNSEVRIDFNKRGFDGVLIESRRTGEEGWMRLGTDNYSPYTDSRPPVQAGHAEVREYRLRFMLRDEAVGD
ncbi:MAG TPA: hypothetical protein VF658_20070 [Pyrinomonadaceae bacterium]|jgi:hypothetical protein